MRVDFVITELYVGGAERCLTELAIGLAELGDDVRVFSLAALPVGPQRLLAERLQSAGISVQSAEADSPWLFASAYRQLKRWYRQSPPEISQSFLYHANVLAAFAAAAAAADGAVVAVGGIRVAEARPVRCRIERAAVTRMRSVVCVSNAVQRFAAERLGCTREKSVVIPNGVDVARFAQREPFEWSALGWPENAIVTLFVGRLHPQKGIEMLQQQIDTLAPERSDRRLLLVGDGPLRDELRDWASQIGNHRVQLLGWRSDIAPLMRACRLLVLPSRYEGMPNVVLEAMAAGRPVVCSRVEGCEELLSHAHRQQSFTAGDSAAMKQCVETLLSDQNLCDRIGRDNQDRARNDFSIPAMVRAYRSHYQQLLNG